MKDSSKKILVLGITGTFGGGKTTVAGMFEDLGASVIDADRIYHQLIKRGSPVYKRIISTFGREIFKENGQIDRKKLAQVAFNSKESLKKLSQITHPAIIREMKIKLSKLKKRTKRRKIAIIDAPLLIEAGLLKMVNKLMVVKTGRKNQITRCKRRWKVSRTEIMQRIKSQVPLRKKIKLADYIIDNDGRLRETRKQVKEIWKQETKNLKRKA